MTVSVQKCDEKVARFMNGVRGQILNINYQVSKLFQSSSQTSGLRGLLRREGDAHDFITFVSLQC